MKIVVIDNRTIMGAACEKAFAKTSDVTTLVPNKESGDPFQDFKSLEIELLERRPTHVIYAARISRTAEFQNCEQWYINAHLAKLVELFCVTAGIHYTYLSTDCVFEGNECGYLFDKNHFPNSISVYGRSKAYGEPRNFVRTLTVRCSVLGLSEATREEELFDWFLRQSGSVQSYINIRWNGIFVHEFGRWIISILREKRVGRIHLHGVPHTKDELLSVFSGARGLPLNRLIPTNGKIPWRMLKGECVEVLPLKKRIESMLKYYG
jgi:dTDP-4-dehydrorhamnose reductase